MSLEDQIAEAERMQRWGYAQQLRDQLAAETGEVGALYEPEPPQPVHNDVHDLEFHEGLSAMVSAPDPENTASEGEDLEPEQPEGE